MLDASDNPRVVIGGNNPPPDVRADMRRLIEALQDQAAGMIAAHPAFTDDAMLSQAAELKREIEQAAKAAESARKKEKQPHDEAGKEVQAYWLPLLARADAAAEGLASRMRAEMSRRKAIKDAQEREAREEAARLLAEAEKASEAAFQAIESVAAGEVTDTNHLEAKAKAIEAHEAAKAAAADAERIARTTAGVRVDGAATVTIRTQRKVRLAFPKNGNRAQRAAALLDFMECIGRTSSGLEMTDTMLRLANRVYREMKVVPPHCEEFDEERVA